MIEHNTWQAQAVSLANTKVLSWRQIAEIVKIPRTTVSDFLRKYYREMSGKVTETLKTYERVDGSPKTHLVIPDTQVKPGISFDYLRWIGEYIVRKRPDVVVHLADHADMPSLSSYDKGKKSAEGRRVQDDIDWAVGGMKALLKPLRDLQEQQRANGEEVYNPRLVLTLGNHEDRITRHVNANPELHGFLSIDDLQYKELGWEVYDFLTPVEVDGIVYCHYFPNVMTGKPLGGTAANMLKTIGQSFTMGHRQCLDVATRFLPANGQQQWGIVAGAAYVHEEDYKGFQGNKHWRGLILKHNVKNGSYDPLFVSMKWLEEEYGK
jgi:hypothetical protein